MSKPESWIDEEGNTHYGTKPKNAKEIKQTSVDGPKIRFEIESTKEFKDLQDENATLKGRLISVAEKEFDRQVDLAIEEGERLGLDVHFISNPEELRYVQKQIENKKDKKPSSREIPLQNQLNYPRNPNNEGKSVRDMEFSSHDEMFQTLNTLRKKGTPEQRREANRILTELTKKAAIDLTRGSQYEFIGSLKDAKKNPEEKNKWRKVK